VITLPRRTPQSSGSGALAPLDPLDLGTRPRALADAMPDLMVEAKNLAASLLAGLHGRKRAGPGQSFWQFRQYGSGDASSRIDWRRSARGDALFVREMEWESAHTVRLSVDMSSSMRFASPDAREPKRDRAVIMALALSAMLAKGGERVGLIGGERPKTGDAALNTMALELITRDTDKSGKHRWSDMTAVKPREDVIILSDFLFDETSRDRLVEQLVARGARAHLGPNHRSGRRSLSRSKGACAFSRSARTVLRSPPGVPKAGSSPTRRCFAPSPTNCGRLHGLAVGATRSPTQIALPPRPCSVCTKRCRARGNAK
jgi:uncharacterized protein (DUF58 family)